MLLFVLSIILTTEDSILPASSVCLVTAQKELRFVSFLFLL